MAQQKTVPGRVSPLIIDAILDMQRRGYLGFLHDIWQKHGDLSRIKIGPEEMFLAVHPDHVKEISVTQREVFGKGSSYDPVRELLLGQGLVTSTGALWRRQRRLMAPFFTPRGIQQFTDILVEEAQGLAAEWAELAPTGEEVDVLDEMTRVTGSIILRTMFDMETNAEMESLRDAFELILRYLTANTQNPLSIPRWVPTKFNRDYDAAITLIDNHIYGLINQRRAIPQEEWPDDLLTRLMTSADDETGDTMSDQQLRDEVVTIYFAGHETTARTMTFTWYALDQNPEVAARLQEELDAVVGSQGFTVEALKQMPYTMYVIKETMRLYPAAPVYIRDAFEDTVLDGVPLRKGARVLLSPYLTHRHPTFWPQPERFDPLRWTPEAENERHPYAYHPFAAGQRICLGNNFSLLESHILLAVLAHRFAPKLRPGHQPEIVMEGTLNVTNGMPMTLHAR